MKTQPSEVNQILRFSVFSFIIAIIIITILAFTIPFTVSRQATYDETTSETITNLRIREQGTLYLDEGRTGRIEILNDSGAYAYVTGPANWKLLQAKRRGTAFEHITHSDNLVYSVVIEQSEGTVVYDFSHANPTIEKFNLILRLPEGEFNPKYACFQATTPADTSQAIAEIPCYGQINTGAAITPLPTLSTAP